MPQQRFRVWFAKSERVRYISHLDVLRYWERAIRRAGLPLAYSQGFTPHPKIAFAGPLPLGFASEAELMDVTLDERVSEEEFRAKVLCQATGDFAIAGMEEVPLLGPAPQSIILWADYRVELPEVPLATAEQAVREFMALSTLEWTEQRREKARTYDLRAAVASLASFDRDGLTCLRMRISNTPDLTARPEQVLAALIPGAEPGLITRTGLLLDETSPAREAWRRKGQYQS
ncbi:hypothetical protein AYO38_00845 [bacterium SCGC AG-212-C10]|nr:hypothetical protein AYO38_00845 [bacterium SCGC AG-212-C10]